MTGAHFRAIISFGTPRVPSKFAIGITGTVERNFAVETVLPATQPVVSNSQRSTWRSAGEKSNGHLEFLASREPRVSRNLRFSTASDLRGRIEEALFDSSAANSNFFRLSFSPCRAISKRASRETATFLPCRAAKPSSARAPVSQPESPLRYAITTPQSCAPRDRTAPMGTIFRCRYSILERAVIAAKTVESGHSRESAIQSNERVSETRNRCGFAPNFARNRGSRKPQFYASQLCEINSR